MTERLSPDCNGRSPHAATVAASDPHELLVEGRIPGKVFQDGGDTAQARCVERLERLKVDSLLPFSSKSFHTRPQHLLLCPTTLPRGRKEISMGFTTPRMSYHIVYLDPASFAALKSIKRPTCAASHLAGRECRRRSHRTRVGRSVQEMALRLRPITALRRRTFSRVSSDHICTVQCGRYARSGRWEWTAEAVVCPFPSRGPKNRARPSGTKMSDE